MTDATTMRALSPQELAERRAAAERTLRGSIDAFVLFPSETNLIGIVTTARDYQSAWMNDVGCRAQDQRSAAP